MINQPFIKLFKAAGEFYVYDINSNQVLKISQSSHDALLEIMKRGGQWDHAEINQDLLALLHDGYLKDNPIRIIKHPYSSIFKSYLRGKMNSLILEITQKCNFRCEYCDYSSDEFFNRNHCSKSMSLEMAKKAIDMYFENSIYENTKSIAFYGGEPLLAYSLIKECVKYINSKSDGNNIIYRMTTNASILTEDMIRFLSENKFRLTISLDGPRYYHDKNRKLLSTELSGTFNLVYDKLLMIHKLQNKYPLKININAVWDGSLPKKEIEDFFINDPVISQYPFEINSMYSSNLNNYFTMEEDDILIDKKARLKKLLIRHFQGEKTFMRNEGNEYLIDSLNNHAALTAEYHHSGMCIAGQKNLYVTSDGDFFPCEKFSTNCKYAQIGTIESGLDHEKINRLLNFGQITQEECKNCWAIRLCSMCVLCANGRDVLSREVKLAYCTQRKRMILEDLKSIASLIAIDKTISE